ncbi:hypothetical protein EV363DRAFT_1400562 [Boletus edulis]|nr:hypothetical protein EV363DRAFT_1400562 [Boletus edulis]
MHTMQMGTFSSSAAVICCNNLIELQVGITMATPPISPQQTQQAARQAECEQSIKWIHHPPTNWLPTALPVQPHYIPNQQPPMGYQAFSIPPQQPVNIRVDYNARLMNNFNATHQHWHNRRSNCCNSAAQACPASEDVEHRRQLELQQQQQQLAHHQQELEQWKLLELQLLVQHQQHKNALNQLRQLSQALVEEALHEYSQCSAEQYI